MVPLEETAEEAEEAEEPVMMYKMTGQELLTAASTSSGIGVIISGVFAFFTQVDDFFDLDWLYKHLFAQAGLDQAKYVSFLKKTWSQSKEECYAQVEGELGYPCFVKPANLGSSVGISKCRSREELDQAFELAFQYDRKIVVEEGVIRQWLKEICCKSLLSPFWSVSELRCWAKKRTLFSKWLNRVTI